MTCPGCNSPSSDNAPYCIRCGFALARGPLVSAIRSTVAWVMRRSLAGMTSGIVGWWVIPAASRAAGASLSQTGHLLMTGLLGGIFLGTVEGMMEKSAMKTIRGGIAGSLGGLVGGGFGLIALHNGTSESAAGMMAVVLTWACSGGAIGTAVAWYERHATRVLSGALAGILGGAMGGWLGYQMYASLVDIAKPDVWVIKRLIEGTTGGILGAVLWCILGLVSKLFILKRRPVHNISYKECDVCGHTNVLKAWYCAACGAILQVAAPPEKLELPRRQALARFISACQYLGRLTATTSTVVACLAGLFLGSINVFLGLFGFLVTGLIGYILYVLWNTTAEALSPLL